MDGIWVLNVFVTQSWFPTSHSQKYHHFPFAKIILCQTVCTSTSFVSKHDKVAQVKSEKINDFFLLCMNAIILYDFSYIKFSLANHGVWQKYKCKLSRTKGKNFKFYLNIRIQLWDDATLFYFRFIFYDGFFLWFCFTIIRSIIIIWRFWKMNVVICVKEQNVLNVLFSMTRHHIITCAIKPWQICTVKSFANKLSICFW